MSAHSQSDGRQNFGSRATARSAQAKLLLAALGVVYGDIGTSPLYAIRECFNPTHGVVASAENIIGVLSLIFWALSFVVTFKYLFFILRADNRGEGGIMALLALIVPKLAAPKPGADPTQAGYMPKRRLFVLFAGLFGASLLFGEGVITPAISVLSAVEGLEIATPAFSHWVVPITVAILITLFSFQSRGTAKVGSVFGVTTLFWFFTIALIGIPWIYQHPDILHALNPYEALAYFLRQPKIAFLSLGSAVLCITGAEALYADMGHFGRGPIRSGWMWIVMPALILNYFGQGAFLLSLAQSEGGVPPGIHPFYGMVSGSMVIPLAILATLAAIIASQALISGAFSLTQQAVQLGYLPRLNILHTSETTEGQIYIPRVNEILMVSCITLVLFFQESTRLAAAYGIAVTGTMMISSFLYFQLCLKQWEWPLWKATLLFCAFLSVDVTFFSSNAVKFFHGGWIPLLIACILFGIMTTWKRGRALLSHKLMQASVPLAKFIGEIPEHTPRVPGTAIFMTLTRDIAPSVLLHHFRHNQVLHQNVILLSVVTKNQPSVDTREKVRVTEFDSNFFKVVANYGYMENPDISEILGLCEGAGLTARLDHVSFYLGRETYLTSGESGLAHWRKRLFVFMSRNARPATDYFRIPADQVIEIGSQITI